MSCLEPQPLLKSAINFPSLLRPARPRASPRLLTRRAPLAAPVLRPPASARRTLLPGPLCPLLAGRLSRPQQGTQMEKCLLQPSCPLWKPWQPVEFPPRDWREPTETGLGYVPEPDLGVCSLAVGNNHSPPVTPQLLPAKAWGCHACGKKRTAYVSPRHLLALSAPFLLQESLKGSSDSWCCWSHLGFHHKPP